MQKTDKCGENGRKIRQVLGIGGVSGYVRTGLYWALRLRKFSGFSLLLSSVVVAIVAVGGEVCGCAASLISLRFFSFYTNKCGHALPFVLSIGVRPFSLYFFSVSASLTIFSLLSHSLFPFRMTKLFFYVFVCLFFTFHCSYLVVKADTFKGFDKENERGCYK